MKEEEMEVEQAESKEWETCASGKSVKRRRAGSHKN